MKIEDLKIGDAVCVSSKSDHFFIGFVVKIWKSYWSHKLKVKISMGDHYADACLAFCQEEIKCIQIMAVPRK